jgi:hypothetical protein
VTKTAEDQIVAFCTVCKHDEMMVHNWQETEWAEGMMEAVQTKREVDPRLH